MGAYCDSLTATSFTDVELQHFTSEETIPLDNGALKQKLVN